MFKVCGIIRISKIEFFNFPVLKGLNNFPKNIKIFNRKVWRSENHTFPRTFRGNASELFLSNSLNLRKNFGGDHLCWELYQLKVLKIVLHCLISVKDHCFI